MQLEFTLGENETFVALVVRTADGRLELREMSGSEAAAGSAPAAAAPLAAATRSAESPLDAAGVRSFLLERVRVTDVAVELQKGDVEEALDLLRCVVPENWPRGVWVAANAHIGPAGSLALEEPRCPVCKGKGTSPFAPPGWTGGTCAICDGTGEYTVAAQPTTDDAPLPEEKASAVPSLREQDEL